VGALYVRSFPILRKLETSYRKIKIMLHFNLLPYTLSVSHDVRPTLFKEALSSYFIMIPAMIALFGVVRSSQSNQPQRQLELSLLDLCYVRLMRSSLTFRNCLDFLSTALCGSSLWLHQQQHCSSLLNLDRYALLTTTLPSLLRTSCSLLKVHSKLQNDLNSSLHDKIRIKITTLL